MKENLEKFFADKKAEADKSLDLWEAAVMLPGIETAQGQGVLFEVRSSKLKWQPGDICFPGGRRDKIDASPKDTARREVSEELQIPLNDVKVYGPLEYFYTYSGPVLYPFVGTIKDSSKINANKDEVSELFTISLATLVDMKPRETEMTIASKPQEDFPFDLVPYYSKEWYKRRNYKLYFYEYEDKVIWGMTARVLHNFIEKIK